MTVVNHQTGEIVASYGEVKRSIELARESGSKFFEQIVWQIENHAWGVLAYADWDEMREAEYGDMGVVVPRADRPEIVSRMRRAGLTQTEIAETVGISQQTVSNDLVNTSFGNEAAPIVNSRGQERPASYAQRLPKPIDHAALAGAAVAEFSDLAYYREQGRDRDVVNMADDLRRFRDRGELDMRLDNLRRSICVDRAERDGTYRPGTTAVMNEAGEYEMRPLPTTEPLTPTCPTCGQNIRSAR